MFPSLSRDGQSIDDLRFKDRRFDSAIGLSFTEGLKECVPLIYSRSMLLELKRTCYGPLASLTRNSVQRNSICSALIEILANF